jgi:hypothetical protein
LPTATSPTSTSTETASPAAELLPGYYVEDSTGAWLTLPRFPFGELETIGHHVARWVEHGDGETFSGLRSHLSGEPWRYTPGQLNLLLWWYALEGPGPRPRWRWRSGVRRGAKGTGKDPLLASLALAELCGPTYPVWQGGRWVGRPHGLPLVQIAANSEDQAKDPLRVANGMVDAEMAAAFGFDKGILRTQIGSGGRIEVLTRSEASSEGDPASAIFLNETHHMTDSSGGQALAGVARRNAGKSPHGLARVLEFTNAHMPGEGSVAEDSFDAWQAQVGGQTRRQDILYDSREAPPHLSLHDEAQLDEGLRAAYADSPWTDLERIRSEAQDPRVPLADSIRYYFSSLPTAETAWVDPRKFDRLAKPAEVVQDGEAIALFLDCSKSTDATALSGARISDGHVMALGLWQRPHGDRGAGWLAPRAEVDSAVRGAFARWDVQWFGVDPSPARDDETEAEYWGELVDDWHRDFREKLLLWATPGEGRGSAVRFDMRQSLPGGRERLREFTAVAEQTVQAVEDEPPGLSWDGDPALRLHVHNARRRPNQYGVGLGKRSRDSTQLVDYAVAMVGARLGRRRVLNSGKQRRKRTGRAEFL